MIKKQNKSISKRIKNIVSAALLASVCLSLIAFTPAESKSTVLTSKNTSKSKEGSTAWDNLIGKSGKSLEKTYAEKNDLELENRKKSFVQQGYLASVDDSYNIINIKGVKPLGSKITVKLDDITATKPDKEGYIEVTVPYTISIYDTIAVSKDSYLSSRTGNWCSYPSFMDAYTGDMICCYHWWDYRPEEDYDPGITTVEWGNKTYTIYDYRGDTKDNIFPTEYKETGRESDGLHGEKESIVYYNHIFRIPKDYDGLTMVIMKEYTKDNALAYIESDEDVIHETNGYNVFDKKLYYGVDVTADDFYFVKICDYIKK